MAPTRIATIDGHAVEIERSGRRKTVSIQVGEAGVRVLAPRWVPHREIHDFVEEKSRWITAKLREQRARPRPIPRTYETGEQFVFLGRELTLVIRAGKGGRPFIMADSLIVEIAPAITDRETRRRAVRHQLEWWYRDRAAELFGRMVPAHAAALGVTPKSIGFKSYKARWGSCSAAGALSFDWRLAMAPEPVVDYVAAHEVAHLRHLDHSPAFWQCVYALCPNLAGNRRWLRDNGQTLVL